MSPGHALNTSSAPPSLPAPACLRSLLPAAVPPKKADPTAVAAALKELIAARAPKVAGDEVFAPTLAYVAGLCAALQDTKNFEFDEWNGVASTPFLASFMPEAEAEAVTRAYLVSAGPQPGAAAAGAAAGVLGCSVLVGQPRLKHNKAAPVLQWASAEDAHVGTHPRALCVWVGVSSSQPMSDATFLLSPPPFRLPLRCAGPRR